MITGNPVSRKSGAKRRGCRVYDMGGTGTEYPVPEQSEGYPVFHFKKGFGARVEYLTGYYDLVFRPAAYRFFRLGEERLLPLGVRGAAVARAWLRRLRDRVWHGAPVQEGRMVAGSNDLV